MSKGDIRFFSTGGHTDLPTLKWQTEAAATDILAGEPVKLDSAGSPYVIPFADGDLIIGTSTAMVGIAASDSDHTATADGSVDVYLATPGSVLTAKATTLTNVDTEAKIAALIGDRVTLNLTGTDYTIDENAGDAATSAFYIVGGDHRDGTLQVTVRTDATFLSA